MASLGWKGLIAIEIFTIANIWVKRGTTFHTLVQIWNRAQVCVRARARARACWHHRQVYAVCN
jgi:hypothetical protein